MYGETKAWQVGGDLWWKQDGDFGSRAVPVALNMMWITRDKTFSCHCNSCVIKAANHILLFSFQQLICLHHLGSHYISSDKSLQRLAVFLKVPGQELLHLLVLICQHLNMWEQLQKWGLWRFPNLSVVWKSSRSTLLNPRILFNVIFCNTGA